MSDDPTLTSQVRILLSGLGEDPDREGLLKTPERVVKALRFLTQGYGQDPREVLNEALFTVTYDEMVLIREIDVFSLCEHHLLPFFGKAHVAYVPDRKIVGLSEIVRLVEIFARRLQVQERLTQDIARTIEEQLEPAGVGVVIEAQHLCMQMRGVEKHTLSFTGTATDADIPAQTLTFSLDAGAPAGATIHPSTGAFSWTPTLADIGPHSVTVRVADNGIPSLDDFETITITVTETNEAPTVDPIADQSVDEGSTLNLQATATDPNAGDIITFSLDAGPGTITPAGAYSFTAGETDGGNVYLVTVRGTDSGMLFDTEDISITVNELNTNPTIIMPEVKVNAKKECFKGLCRGCASAFS